MPKSREQLVSQDISNSEKNSREPGLELAKTPELEKAVNRANELAEAIQQDQPVTAEAVLDLERELGNLKVIVGGEEMTIEEARQIPDLKRNMEIWEEIRERNLDNFFNMTYLATDIARLLVFKQRGAVLDLKSLKRISNNVADILEEHRGSLFLEGIEELSDNAAESLSKHKGKVVLSGLKPMSDRSASYFINFPFDLNVSQEIKEQISRLKRERDEKK